MRRKRAKNLRRRGGVRAGRPPALCACTPVRSSGRRWPPRPPWPPLPRPAPALQLHPRAPRRPEMRLLRGRRVRAPPRAHPQARRRRAGSLVRTPPRTLGPLGCPAPPQRPLRTLRQRHRAPWASAPALALRPRQARPHPLRPRRRRAPLGCSADQARPLGQSLGRPAHQPLGRALPRARCQGRRRAARRAARQRGCRLRRRRRCPARSLPQRRGRAAHVTR